MVENEQSQESDQKTSRCIWYLKIIRQRAVCKFDLGILNKHNYYTGIIFKSYTYGTGDAVLKGGRYDNLIEQFGKESPISWICDRIR